MRGTFLSMICIFTAFSAAAAADQRDLRLEGLFGRLQQTEVRSEAEQIEGEIWSLWSTSEDEISNTLMRQGVLAMQARRYDLALRQFDLLVEHEPGFSEGWNKRATVLYIVGKYRASIENIKRVLALESRHFEALSGLGMCYEALADPESAIAAYCLALKVNPHLPEARSRIDALVKEIRRNNI